jgi:hypothetical protein
MSGYKRPGEGDHGGGPAAKRPAYDEAPDFLDDEDDDVGEADDVFFDAALLDAGAARLADAAAGARPHWQRPRLPPLDPSTDTVCACPVTHVLAVARAQGLSHHLHLPVRLPFGSPTARTLPCATTPPSYPDFQQLDLDYIIAAPHTGLNTPLQQVAVVRLFGVTSTGAWDHDLPALLAPRLVP